MVPKPESGTHSFMVRLSQSYVICTSPRTGSSLLCAALRRTNVAGRPAEYFDVYEPNEMHWRKALEINDESDYFNKVLAAGTTSNGVFGFKLHWHQSPALKAKLLAHQEWNGSFAKTKIAAKEPGLEKLLRDHLGGPRYIWLRRQNTVAQAISYYRAGKTGLWRIPVVGNLAAALSPAPPPFDYEEIAENLKKIEEFDRSWSQFFMQQRAQALIVMYEDFIRNYETTVRDVLAFLDLKEPALKITPPHYKQQADETSAAWEKAFREISVNMSRTSSQHPTPSRANRSVSHKRQKESQKPAFSDTLLLVAYDVGSGTDMKIGPAKPSRSWMDTERFLYRCLPMVIANQYGWMIHNRQRLTVTWDGSPGRDGVSVVFDGPCRRAYASSHFGHGILTFNVGRLFRTPPGYNLHVRGPANWPKDGIAALEGIVETDWAYTTFTMNWKITRPGQPITFEANEPIAMIVPVKRHEIERFRPEIRSITVDPAWEAGYREWSNSRSRFNNALKTGEAHAVAVGWQRHYFRGVTLEGEKAPEHQTALSLAGFTDKRNSRDSADRGDREALVKIARLE